jgi:carboxymethylenebutenolidase
LYHEHIAWDQATVLIQLGLLPKYLSYPHLLPRGRQPALGNMFEFRVPAAGVETVAKMLDKDGVSPMRCWNTRFVKSASYDGSHF